MRFLNNEQLHERWLKGRDAAADRWFDGDAELAEEFTATLPFSSIPDWDDVNAVMEFIERHGLR